MENPIITSALPTLIATLQTASPAEVDEWEKWLAKLTPGVADKLRALGNKKGEHRVERSFRVAPASAGLTKTDAS